MTFFSIQRTAPFTLSRNSRGETPTSKIICLEKYRQAEKKVANKVVPQEGEILIRLRNDGNHGLKLTGEYAKSHLFTIEVLADIICRLSSKS